VVFLGNELTVVLTIGGVMILAGVGCVNMASADKD